MPDRFVSERAFAGTYDGGNYDDAWAAVTQYRRAVTYYRDNPDAGIAEIVRASGADREPVVSWIDDGATLPVADAIYTAYDYGVLELTADDLPALNILVAHALTAGTVNTRNYQPTFTVESPAESLVVNALELLGFGWQQVADAEGDRTTIGPETDAAILGRTLSVLGVPTGAKTDAEDLSLPSYLEVAPDSVRRQFVDVYLEQRGHRSDSHGGLVIREQRPQSYREGLAALIESVAGERVTATQTGVSVSVAAARALGRGPPDSESEPNSEPILDEQELAQTYDGGNYTDAWSAVTGYREVMDYAAEHPDAGSQAIATALDLPRSRVRPWLEGSAPAPVQGIETARDYGWLEATYGDPAFTALNTLVSDIFSGGSITTETYTPSFALNHRGEESHVIDALELAGLEYQVVDRDGRADEARPTTDASVLGRVLATLGAPVGPKADQRLSLPAYLEDAPASVREQFVFSYLENRAVEHAEKATLTVREDRNCEYLEELAALIDDVAGGGVDLRERGIVVSADAARELGAVR